jgi:hypothetical protein
VRIRPLNPLHRWNISERNGELGQKDQSAAVVHVLRESNGSII